MSSDETTKHLVINKIAIDLNVLDALMKGTTVGEEDRNLSINKFWLDPLY